MVTEQIRQQARANFVYLYDTTLRDGAQRKGLSFSLEDKLRITSLLDAFQIPYIEGGWPGSNPKDAEFFRQIKARPPKHSRIVAFGSTRRVGITAEEDANLRALVDAGTSACAIVGKSSSMHVQQVLQTDLEENLRMIAESITFLKRQGKEVIFDAEHFFDGFEDNPEYAVKVVGAAQAAGADWIVLCDTNGRSTPRTVARVVAQVLCEVKARYGIHAHNDSELAVANSLAAVEAGASQIQGTVNGYGERCGNANLISLIPTLQLKLGFSCVPDEQMRKLTELSRTVSEIANLNPDPCAAYVGSSAFAHKAGLHVAAVERVAHSYEHINPEVVGNKRQVIVSELSGRGNIRMLAADLGLGVTGSEQSILERVKELEGQGYQFENAEGTVELLMRRAMPNYRAPFELIDMMVVVADRRMSGSSAEAVVKVRVGDQVFHTASEGKGPVHALDLALRKALLPAYPSLADVRLADYKVRILDPEQATNATTRVLIEATARDQRWCTVGCSQNIIDASGQALADSLELFLLRPGEHKSGAVQGSAELTEEVA
ncbi:MAG TPA: citramalate synthase [Candidatus Obscuribacterales bacterium]